MPAWDPASRQDARRCPRPLSAPETSPRILRSHPPNAVPGRTPPDPDKISPRPHTRRPGAVSAAGGRCWVRTNVGLADGFTGDTRSTSEPTPTCDDRSKESSNWLAQPPLNRKASFLAGRHRIRTSPALDHCEAAGVGVGGNVGRTDARTAPGAKAVGLDCSMSRVRTATTNRVRSDIGPSSRVCLRAV
jgi:hypothetical protein